MTEMTRRGGVTVNSLADGIQNGNTAEVRYRAARACSDFGQDANELVPLLIAALEQKDESVRAAVADALGSIGPGAHAAVPALTRVIAGNGTDQQSARTTLRAHVQPTHGCAPCVRRSTGMA